MTLEEIMEQSPEVDYLGGGKWAFYSVGCCWWTSFPEDLGELPDGLPCCPHCGSVLLQAELNKFVAEAVLNPEHYGPGGIATFVKAHHRNGLHGRSWTIYYEPPVPTSRPLPPMYS